MTEGLGELCLSINYTRRKTRRVLRFLFGMVKKVLRCPQNCSPSAPYRSTPSSNCPLFRDSFRGCHDWVRKEAGANPHEGHLSRNSETGQLRFRRARLQTPSSVSFLVLSGALSEFLAALYLRVSKRTHRVFRRTHRVCRRTQ